MSPQPARKSISAVIKLSEVCHLDSQIQELLSSQPNSRKIITFLKKRYGKLSIKVHNNEARMTWTLKNVDMDAENIHKLALSCARKRKFQQAIAKWTQAVVRNPEDPDYYFNLGLAFFENKNYREAIENLTQTISICPIYQRAYLILGTIFLKIRKFSEAEKKIRESIYFNNNNALAYLNLGAVYSILKKYEEAVTSFQHVIKLAPREIRAYFGLAKIYSIIGDTESANTNYRKVIELDQKGVLAAHAQKGLVSLSENDNGHVEPEAALEEISNEDLETLYIEGYKSFLYSDYQNAASMYQKYLSRKNKDDHIWAALGVVLQRSGAPEKAMKAFQQASKLNPAKGLYFKQLAISYDSLGKAQEAVDALAKASELGKVDSVSLSILGKNLIKLDDFTEAITQLEQSVQSNKANLLGHLNLAIALLKVGEKDRAVNHIEVIMSSKINTPLKEQAKELIEQIRD